MASGDVKVDLTTEGICVKWLRHDEREGCGGCPFANDESDGLRLHCMATSSPASPDGRRIHGSPAPEWCPLPVLVSRGGPT